MTFLYYLNLASSYFSFLLLFLLSSSSLNADYRGEGGAMDGEGRSQTDYYTIRVSNPSSSGEAYFIVSAIAACTYNTDLSSYTYITQYITWVSHNFLDRSSDPPYSRQYVRLSTYSGG